MTNYKYTFICMDHFLSQGILAIIRCRTFSFPVCCPKILRFTTHRTIIFPLVLYGCESWSLTLKEKRRLRVFQNMALRRIFGPKRDEVTGEWKKLHNEELDLYSSPKIARVIKSRRIRWA